MAAAAGLAVLDELDEQRLIERVATMGPVLEQRLRERFGDHPHVGDIRGRGFLWGLEFVADRAGKEPFPAEAKVAARLKAAAMTHGLLCYPTGGTADGVNGDHVIIAPPYIITEAESDQLCDLLAAAIGETVATLPSGVGG